MKLQALNVAPPANHKAISILVCRRQRQPVGRHFPNTRVLVNMRRCSNADHRVDICTGALEV
jgi:hypothetical protein